MRKIKISFNENLIKSKCEQKENTHKFVIDDSSVLKTDMRHLKFPIKRNCPLLTFTDRLRAFNYENHIGCLLGWRPNWKLIPETIF